MLKKIFHMTTFRTLVNKFRRYLTVGAFNTLLNFSIMYLSAMCGLHYLVYTPIGYLTTIILSFFMNLHYTFKVKDKQGARLLGFLSVSLVNLGIVELIEYVLIEQLAFSRWLAIFLGMGWYVVFGFVLNNYVVYRHFPLKKELIA
jgi:putative flippase GtrA